MNVNESKQKKWDYKVTQNFVECSKFGLQCNIIKVFGGKSLHFVLHNAQYTTKDSFTFHFDFLLIQSGHRRLIVVDLLNRMIENPIIKYFLEGSAGMIDIVSDRHSKKIKMFFFCFENYSVLFINYIMQDVFASCKNVIRKNWKIFLKKLFYYRLIIGPSSNDYLQIFNRVGVLWDKSPAMLKSSRNLQYFFLPQSFFLRLSI